MKYLLVAILSICCLGPAAAQKKSKPAKKARGAKVSGNKAGDKKTVLTKPAQPGLHQWGEVIYTAVPTYKITDNGTKIEITIDSVSHRKLKDSLGTRQIQYKSQRKITFTKDEVEDRLIPSFDKRLRNGTAYPIPGIKPLDYKIEEDSLFPALPVVETTVLSIDENGFRQKYRALLLPPFEDWTTIYDSGPVVSVQCSSTTAMVTTQQYKTKETVWFGHTLRVSYRDSSVESYVCVDPGQPGNHKTFRTLLNFKSDEMNVAGPWLTFSAGANTYQMPIPGLRKISPPGAPVSAGTTIPYEDTDDPFYFPDRRSFYELYDNLYWNNGGRPVVCATLNYSACYAYRTNRIVESQFTHATEEQARRDAEDGRYGQLLDLHLGLTWRRTHTVFASLLYLQGGFQKSDNTALDWNTGLAGAGDNNLRVEQYGGGIGYNYTSYNEYRRFGGTFEGALLYLHQPAHEEGLRWNQFGIRVAAGVTYRPSYPLDFHLMPTVVYSLSSLNKGTIIRSNLYNIGITAGVTCRFRRKG